MDSYSQNTFINKVITSDYSFFIIKVIDKTQYKKEENHDAEMTLRIPEIELDTPVLLNVDVTNETNITDKPVHYQASDYPSEKTSNIAIFGHRTINVFLFLNHLSKGDKIYLDYHDQTFVYQVEKSYFIEPDDWSVIERTKYPVITLITCDRPIGEPQKRFIVRGFLTEDLDEKAD